MNNTSNLIRKLTQNSFPLMGVKYVASDYFPIDLSIDNPDLPTENLTSYITDQSKKHESTLAYGGYREIRGLYQSNLFMTDGEIRNIHLAVDVWTSSGHPIYAPLDGVVHSISYNGGELDYGHTLILKHYIEDLNFFTLYGHLSSSILTLRKEGDAIDAGSIVGHLGDYEENGGWDSHVHCQIIIDLKGNQGDYPGVCSEEKKEYYFRNCPDPINLILPN